MNVFDLQAVLSIDTSKYEQGLFKAQTLGSSLQNGLHTMAKVGEKAMLAVGGAVAVFGAKAVKAGADFDSAMSNVAATMGKTMDDMEKEVGSTTLTLNGQTKEFTGTLREFALELGKNTSFSATQAADALNYMALAGYDTQKSMDMLPSVLNLAAAGEMDLARASDMITDSQTAFGLSTERTSKMVDEMAKAASTGNTSVEQLGDAFLTVGGLAQELNGGMVKLKDGTSQSVDGVQELEIALTAMANAGVKGSEAGTHMRNMLLKLSTPSAEGTKQLEAMGVAVFDNTGKMRSLSDVFGDLSGKLSNMTQEQKIQAVSDLFNTRDLASAEALLNAVGQDWDSIGESILDAQGAAQQMADTKLDNLEGDTIKFKSALEGAYIQLSDSLQPSLRYLVQSGTEMLGKLTTYIDEHSEEINEVVTKIIDKVVEGIDWISNNFDTIISIAETAAKVIAGIWVADKVLSFVGVIKKVIDVFSLVKVAMGALNIAGAISKVSGLLSGLMGIVKSLFAVLMANPIVLIIAGVAALIAYLAYLWNTNEEFKNKVIEIWTAIKDFFGQVWDAITGFFSGAWNAITGIFGSIGDWFKEKATAIKNAFGDIGGWFKDKFSTAKNNAVNAWSNVKSKFGEKWTNIKTAFGTVGSWFSTKFSDAKNKAVGAWDNVKSKFSTVWTKIKGAFQIKDALTWGKDMIDNFIKGIKSKITAVTNAVKGVAGTVKSFLGFSEPEKGPLSNFHTFAPDMMDLFMEGIEDNKRVLQDTVSDAFDFKPLISSPSANSGNTTITINVQGAQGQDVNELANIISRKLNNELRRSDAVWA